MSNWLIQFNFADEDHDDGLLLFGAIGPEGIGWSSHPNDAKRFTSREQAELFLQNGYGPSSQEIAELVEVAA